MASERITLTDVMLYDVGREDGSREAAAEISRLTRELEAAREENRRLREALEEARDDLADMHSGEECVANGGDGCLACYAQERIGDALAARRGEGGGK